MEHTKRFIRSDGTKIETRICGKTSWKWDVLVCAPKSIAWVNPAYREGRAWSKKPKIQRAKEEKRSKLEHVTIEEVHETKMELWRKLKPE